jgi:tripartite-type tricarboxylate transporter receptor subunit TctC
MAQTWFQQGAEPGGEASEQFAQFIRTEIEKWGKVARDNKITVE